MRRDGANTRRRLVHITEVDQAHNACVRCSQCYREFAEVLVKGYDNLRVPGCVRQDFAVTGICRPIADPLSSRSFRQAHP